MFLKNSQSYSFVHRWRCSVVDLMNVRRFDVIRFDLRRLDVRRFVVPVKVISANPDDFRSSVVIPCVVHLTFGNLVTRCEATLCQWS